MSFWNYIVLGLCLAMLVFLCWKEVRRMDRHWMAGRVMATVVAVGALCCIVLPLYYQREVFEQGKERVLLTEGYREDSVSAFLRVHPGVTVDTVGGGSVQGTEAGSGRWQVFGYGLTKEEWEGLRPVSLVLHEPGGNTGILGADWTRELSKGEPLVVEGRWAGKKIKLFLTGLGKVLDSADVVDEFRLSVAPAQAGKAVYSLVAVAGADTLEREELPVEVRADKAIKILVLASSPDFENTFLINWLSKKGDEVASRTAVSRGKYHLSFVNMEERPLEPLSAAVLGAFDLVVADASALPAAGTAGSVALRRQVEDNGLGLIIKVDSAGAGGWGQAMIVRAKDSSQRLFIVDRPGIRALVRDTPGRMVVGCVRDGAGKVIFSTSNTSYSEWMEGRQGEYAAYWGGLLRQVAREGEKEEQWDWQPALAGVGMPMVGEVETEAALPQGVVGATAVYLAQDVALPFRWRGRYWPVAAGWMEAHTPGGDTSWRYIWPMGAWAAADRERRWAATQEYQRKLGPEEAETTMVREKAALPKGWLYVLFVLAMLFLWVERKMSGMNG